MKCIRCWRPVDAKKFLYPICDRCHKRLHLRLKHRRGRPAKEGGT